MPSNRGNGADSAVQEASHSPPSSYGLSDRTAAIQALILMAPPPGGLVDRPANGLRSGAADDARTGRNTLLGYAAALALIGCLLPLGGLWAAQLVLVLLLFTVPGLLLLRTLRVPGALIESFPVYIPAASLLVLLVSGLVVDLTGLVVGLSAPLRPLPLLVGLEIICAGLLWASRGASVKCAIGWKSLPGRPVLAVPLALPLLAAGGATQLNEGH